MTIFGSTVPIRFQQLMSEENDENELEGKRGKIGKQLQVTHDVLCIVVCCVFCILEVVVKQLIVV